jgi:hypothetical protein
MVKLAFTRTLVATHDGQQVQQHAAHLDVPEPLAQ